MNKFFKRLWTYISDSFVSVAVLMDESRHINEDGSYDKYWKRKNKKEREREANER